MIYLLVIIKNKRLIDHAVNVKWISNIGPGVAFFLLVLVCLALLVLLAHHELLGGEVEPRLGQYGLAFDLDGVLEALHLAKLVNLSLLGYLEDGLGHAIRLDWLVAVLTCIRLHLVVLGAPTEVRLAVHDDPVHVEGVRHQLMISVVVFSAAILLALVDFLLRMSPVVLSPVAARVEALRAEKALEWLGTSVDPLMDLEVRLGVERASTHFLDPCTS